MTRVLKPFEYVEPKTVEEAVQLLSRYGAKAKLIAGGCDLVPGMLHREITPESIVSIGGISELDYIENDGEGLKFGAMTSIRSLELFPAVKKDYTVLYEAIRSITKIQVKTSGTAVGNLCVASPASDIVPALLVLGAELKVAGTGGERVIPIEDFCIGVKQCSLQPGEIVTEVFIPFPPAGTGSAFMKLARTASDIAKVNVAVLIAATTNICDDARIALGSVAPTAIRTAKAEDMLKGQKLDHVIIEKAAQAASEEASPITDIRSTAEYRKETARVLVRRTILKAVECESCAINISQIIG